MVVAGGTGFVRAYKTSNGSPVLTAQTKSRVNELDLPEKSTRRQYPLCRNPGSAKPELCPYARSQAGAWKREEADP